MQDGWVENKLYSTRFLNGIKKIKMPTFVSYTLLALLALSLPVFAETGSVTNRDHLSKAFQNAKRIGNDVYSIAGTKSKSKEKGTDAMLAELGDDDVLVSIEGWDTLKWGLLRRHVEVLCAGIANRPEMRLEGNTAMRRIANQEILRKLLKEYLEHAVLAVEAKRIGITVKPEEFEKYRAMAKEGYAQRGETGKALLSLMESGESFYEHNLTNALYWQAYKTQELAPLCQTDDKEIEKMIRIRHSANVSCVTTNLYKKTLIAEIQKKLNGGMEFGEAAEKWSDCESSLTRGVVMDAMEEHPERFEKGELPEAVEAALSQLKEGETSGIIETPTAWYIVRLLKRNISKDDEDSTVEIAQIMLEKEMLEPEFSPAQARNYIETIKMRAVLKATFYDLVKKVKIDSKIPLWDPAGSDASRRRIKRIK